MKLKDFNPTYDLLEMIEVNRERTAMHLIGLIPKTDANKKFGEWEVLSVKDYHDTKSTSVIIECGKEKK